MSVAELPGASSEFERTPPHDMAAEQCVLGGMMLSKDAISDVVEILNADDFYRPAHQVVFDAIIDLYARGEPVDPVTCAAELTKRSEIQRSGGAPYLHTLISSVPTAANAGYYAKIVRERGILRRLIEAGTRIVQIGYSVDGEIDEAVDQAQAEIYNVTENRSSEDYRSLSEVMPGALDEIEAIGSRGGAMVGVPTGFSDLDALMNGLHPGQLIIVAARPAIGKALALDTALPTPSGWTTMGDVRVGDELIGAGGRPTRVVAATEVMHGRPCYEVEFADGEVIVADAQHQWRTTTRAEARVPVAAGAAVASEGAYDPAIGAGEPGAARTRRAVTTTERIAHTLRRPDGLPNHTVEVATAFRLPHADLPVDPYDLGARLGAGDGADVSIPRTYLRASEEQRRALLAGLRATGGQAGPDGRIRIAVARRELAEAVRELVLGLGYRAAMTPGPAQFTIDVTADEPVREIVDVRPVASVPVRCVEVDDADHMYLAGRSCVPTHNSTLGLDFARAASLKNGMTSVIFSLEMSRNEITMRLLSAEARVPLHTMRSGLMSDDDWTRMARRMSEVAEAPMFIDDSPNMSMMEIRAKCRRLKQRHDLKLVIIDYLQLMTSGKRVESRQVEVSEFSRSLKLLAKELEVPVIAVSQLNRGPEQRTDKRPMVSDLRESGSIEQDADVVILLHREDAYEKESPRAGEADLIVAKHRNGPTATVTVAFQGHYSRFVDMAPS
ncbi:MAG TPA: replicative DNA helicase [Streptosporangiaceae bacterium]|jgi:replicative DNA helicase